MTRAAMVGKTVSGWIRADMRVLEGDTYGQG